MLTTAIYICLAIAAAYAIWQYVLQVYFYYYYYKRQGVPAVRFPWPVLANLVHLNKFVQSKQLYKSSPHEEYWESEFKTEKLPPMFLNYFGPIPAMVISDPELANEIYLTKNRYADKAEKFATIIRQLFGNSILFNPF
jgi:hypothetical protein